MAVIFRARAFMLDTNASKIRLATLHYSLGALGLLELPASAFPYIQQMFLARIHDSVGFAMRGIMSPQQGIVRWSSVYWTDSDTVVEPGSHVVYNVPFEDQFGVYDKASIDNAGQAPTACFTVRFNNAIGTEGTPPTRAGFVSVISAPEAVGELPPLFTNISELDAVALALAAPVDVDAIPGISFPLTTAYPIRPVLEYQDELLSTDPDSTANDYIAGFSRVSFVDYSVRPRYKRSHLVAFAGV